MEGIKPIESMKLLCTKFIGGMAKAVSIYIMTNYHIVSKLFGYTRWKSFETATEEPKKNCYIED